MLQIEQEILRALRRLTRAIDLHSRKLAGTYGLTGPQLVCLRILAERGPSAPSVLARLMSLSQGTVTGILDRLAARQLVIRDRMSEDRRVVTISLTPAGVALVEAAPSPLQERFLQQLRELPATDQQALLASLERIVEMMGGEEIEAAAVLSTSPSAQSPEEATSMLDPGVDGGSEGALIPDIPPDDTR